VAERPEPAAVGLGAVGADMAFSLRRRGWWEQQPVQRSRR
jgi:3-hydroxyisobutyrate dehydrogenase-like beta-hydroxyacid dehydrogenase